MKILYDHQIFIQSFGGISRIFYELTNEMYQNKKVDFEISLLLSNNNYISDCKFLNHKSIFPNVNFRGKNRILNYINKLNTVSKLKQKKFDIFHPTYFDPYFLKYIGSKPFVLTVYDMIHEKFQNFKTKNDKIYEHKKLLIERASKIIAISENTKKDIIEILGTDEKKIEVIYLGNSINKKNSFFNIKLPKRYLLFVGKRETYKNFDRFIKSILDLLKIDKSLYLVCVGGGEFDDFTKKFFIDMGISKQIKQYDLNDENLANFYNNALAFVYPSLYEGFGIPILEAFATGCPVVCSNKSSFPEIAGQAACYFDPYDENSIKKEVFKILQNRSLRENLIENGYKQIKKFSWEKTAAQTNEIYKSILK